MMEAITAYFVCDEGGIGSLVDTPANRKDMPDADWSTWVRADELAAVIGFLVSEDASGITGALIPVTGRV